MTRFMGAPSPTTEPHGACISRLCAVMFQRWCIPPVGGGGGKVDISVDINWLPIGIGAPEWRGVLPQPLGREASPTTTDSPSPSGTGVAMFRRGLSAWPSTRVIYLGNVIIRSSTSERSPFGHRLIKMGRGIHGWDVRGSI